MKNWLKLIISLLICQLAGVIGAFFNSFSIKSWYLTLNTPSYLPPSWAFGVVWPILFLLMGIALFLVWRQPKSSLRNYALFLFGLQLVFNIFWSFMFFTLQCPACGLVWIGILWMLILFNIFAFWRISKISGGLLIPYILWVSFAIALNYGFYLLN